MTLRKVFVVTGSLTILLQVVPSAWAQGGLVAPCTGTVQGVSGTVCTLCDIFATGQRVLNFLVSPTGGLVFVLSVIGIMIGGILILISGGNQQLYAKGVFALKAALVGLAIALAAWVIVNTILNALVANPGEMPWPWNQIRC